MNINEQRPLIICLTPIKNEAWILDRFLQCASLWADYIIIADQMSTDGSREIAMKYPKVQIIDNSSTNYNESTRQKLLIDAARQIPSNNRQKLFIALDADEFLASNFHENPEWARLFSIDKGTIIYFSRFNIKPDFQTYWHDGDFRWGFMDDGQSIHTGNLIHSPRIPVSDTAPKITCKNIKVLHYQYIDWDRMMSKHRWYQCFERINRPHLHPITVFRMYHHMYGVKQSDVKRLKPEWFDFYKKQGIDMLSIKKEKIYYWDKQIIDYFEQYGTKHFALLDIWQTTSHQFEDPRSLLQKILHQYLRWSQEYYTRKFPIGKTVRFFDKFLIWLF